MSAASGTRTQQITMAKKTLKNALKNHEARKAQEARAKAAQEAANLKANHVKAKASGAVSKKKKRQHAFSSSTDAAPVLGKERTKLFQPDDTILLVGEGNFSFALSLLNPPYAHPPQLLLATAYDSEKECYEKYPDGKKNVAEIRRIAKRDNIVVFGVDAGDLAGNKALRQALRQADGGSKTEARWSKIVFNFPHVGAGHKDETRNVLANQLLLLRFFTSCAPLLSNGPRPQDLTKQDDGEMEFSHELDETEPNLSADGGDNDRSGSSDAPSHGENSFYHTPRKAGSILVTLRNVKPYTLWDVPRLAKRLPEMYHSISKQAPALAKGQKPPSSQDVSKLLQLGHGKAYQVWRSMSFHPMSYPGYSHRRTCGWREGLSSHENEDILRGPADAIECRTWQLGFSGS